MTTDVKLDRRPKRQYFGWSGLALGIVALALALLPTWIAPLYDAAPKPIPQQATDWLSELKEKAAAAIKMEPPPLPDPEIKNIWRDPHLALSSLLLAFVALVLGILAFVRHEDQRMVACSVALGAGAICAQHFMTAGLILAFAILAGVVLTRYG